MQQVDVNDAKTHLTDLVEAAIKGEEIIITRGNRPIVKLVPIEQSKPQPQFGSAKGMITMSDDFDEPLEEFKEYME
ncbi:MAG: type II toxin-antitoxin system Phd/YefM family antitoxin [Acidobacteriota bacterium]